MNRRSLLLVAIAFVVQLALASVGCQTKASLDGDVDHLLVALTSSDYDHFKADAHPALAKELSKQEFEAMARVIKKLGPLKSKKMTGIQVKAGSPSEGKYDLVFENGSCQLEIKSLSGKLVSFHFTGPDIQRLVKSPGP